MLERSGSELTLGEQACLLGVSRSSLYYAPRPPSDWEVRVKHRIDAIYTEQPFYGSRRIQWLLEEEGFEIGRDAVRQFMREMAIAAIYPKPSTSQAAPQNKTYPYLLRGVRSAYPNHIWGIDITYIPLQRGWMYLVAILDWYSRSIVSWELDQTLQLGFVLEAMQRALAQAKPHICKSDQGSHFTSPQYTQLLLSHDVRISMDSKGRALDNIFTERLWRTIKYEEVYLKDYASPREAREELKAYLRFYNEQRIHQALEYRTPAEVYFAK